MNKPEYEDYYAFDLDGTLAESFEGIRYNHTTIGAPIPCMVDIVKRYIVEGKKVVLFTARATHIPYEPEVKVAIEEWCLSHIGQILEINNVKTPGLRELWDDRARAVQRNTGLSIGFDTNGIRVHYNGWLG